MSGRGESSKGHQLVRMRVAADLEPILAQVVGLGPALAGAFAERLFQAVDHHRRSVIKNHQFPAGKEGGKVIAAGLRRYTRAKGTPPPTDLAQVRGESFASFGDQSELGRDWFKNAEEGKTISTSRWMAVPIDAISKKGLQRRIALRAFRQALTTGRYVITKSGYIVNNADRHDPTQHTVNRKMRRNQRTTIVGVLVKRRRQRKILGFYAQFDRVWPKHKTAMEQDVLTALSVGGIAQLGKRVRVAQEGRIAYREAYEKFLRKKPGNIAGAVEAAKMAAKKVRARGRKRDD